MNYHAIRVALRIRFGGKIGGFQAFCHSVLSANSKSLAKGYNIAFEPDVWMYDQKSKTLIVWHIDMEERPYIPSVTSYAKFWIRLQLKGVIFKVIKFNPTTQICNRLELRATLRCSSGAA